jgi:prepilin-type N-terminal cleavage/methylation domain-containing protein
MTRLRNDDGFTLVELIVAMSIGTIVLMAAFAILDRSVVVSNEVADRSDALQRGRHTMEAMTRQLRSQVCLGEATEPIVAGEGKRNSVAFYADLTDGSDPDRIQKRKLVFDATKGTIVEERYTATGAYPDLVFETDPTRRVIGTKVKPVRDGSTDRAIFRYYRFKDDTTTGELEEIPLTGNNALTTTDVTRTVMIGVAFVSQTERQRPKDERATTFENEVYVRSSDPLQPKEGAICL